MSSNLLWDNLRKIQETNQYPFHMPGHKRQIKDLVNPYEMDITEIDGFDNLHHPEGIIKEMQQEAADIYQAQDAMILVNGSSGGILSAIFAATMDGDKIAIARNCHKSVYHGVQLRHLKPFYLYPNELSYGIASSISPIQLEKLLQQEPEIKCVVITSPTYDGVISDIESISKISHKYNATLIVDEAHGAHLGFHSFFPQNAIRLGADLVIMSLHKTLPAFTQTALLLVQDRDKFSNRVKEFLNMFETSSPSYLLMAGAQRSLRLVTDHKEIFEELSNELQCFYGKAEKFRALWVFQPKKNLEDGYGFDPSKILISTRKCQKTYHGEDLYQQLRIQYGLQLEMAAGEYVIALTSVCDKPEGFDRLYQALKQIDQEQVNTIIDGIEEDQKARDEKEQIYFPYQIEQMKQLSVKLSECEGKVSAEYVYLYPPGIPLIVPGEKIPNGFAQDVMEFKNREMHVEGLVDYSLETIKIVENSRS